MDLLADAKRRYNRAVHIYVYIRTCLLYNEFAVRQIHNGMS